MDIQKIIDNHTAKQIAEAAGISPSLAQKWKTGEKDWRGSRFDKVESLRKALGQSDMEEIMADKYLAKYNGSPTIAKILADDETQRDIARAVRTAESNATDVIDEQVRDLVPDMFIDGLTNFGKDYQFWFANRDKWFDAPVSYLVEVMDNGDYANFLAKHFPDWEA